MVVTGSLDRTLKLWQPQRDRLLPAKVLEGHTDELWVVTFSPDGQTLASSSTGDYVRLWAVLSGKEQAHLEKEGIIENSCPWHSLPTARRWPPAGATGS